MNAISEIEKHAEHTGYSIAGLFRAAGVAYSNWSRWRNGTTSPTLRNVQKLLAVQRKRLA